MQFQEKCITHNGEGILAHNRDVGQQLCGTQCGQRHHIGPKQSSLNLVHRHGTTVDFLAGGHEAGLIYIACSELSMQETAGASGSWHPRKDGSSESSSVATVRPDTRIVLICLCKKQQGQAPAEGGVVGEQLGGHGAAGHARRLQRGQLPARAAVRLHQRRALLLAHGVPQQRLRTSNSGQAQLPPDSCRRHIVWTTCTGTYISPMLHPSPEWGTCSHKV